MDDATDDARVFERCPACDAAIDGTGIVAGGTMRCDRCGTRFAKPKRIAEAQARSGRDKAGLDIHPALAKRHLKRAGDSQPEEAAAPVAADVRILDPVAESIVDLRSEDRVPDMTTTNPGRPARKSMEGPERADTKAQPPAEPMPDIPGYEVLKLIGKGAMGRVYRARHERTGRDAAIKILAPELAARQDFIARFEREGAAMRAVKHPGVVAVLDQDKTKQKDGTIAYWIAMDFVDGDPMRKFMDGGNGKSRAMSPTHALRFARLVVQGLAAAHRVGVIHRDLKPENILVTGEPGQEQLVLVDFGLAGILDEENDPHPNLTKSRMTMGTVNYMAPEQRTDAKRVDQRADVYAAGVIFYELLTGDLPLGRFNLPTERGVQVPQSVDVCIVKALARNPDERFQSADDLDQELATIERELGVPPRPSPPPSAAPPVLQRNDLGPKPGPLRKVAAADDDFGSLSPRGSAAMALTQPASWTRVSHWRGWFWVAIVVGVLAGTATVLLR